MGVHDWKLTLYPNEEEDEITRLRRDEQELNVAQRMTQLGFVPELVDGVADRDIRFTYKKPEPQPQQQAPPQPMMGGGMPPMMPQGGAPPMMPPAGPQMPPNMMQNIMPPPQPGGQGMGIRNRGPAAPQRRTSPGIGSPVTSVQQRGPERTLGQTRSDAINNARNFRGA